MLRVNFLGLLKHCLSMMLGARHYKRYKTICRLLDIKAGEQIIDIGCGGRKANDAGKSFEVYNSSNPITGCDLLPREKMKISAPNFRYVRASATDLSIFKDKHFDVAVSIGMLEHICDEANRRRVCTEIMRIAKKVAIVVPHKFSFIEPHFKLPFFGVLSRNVQFRLVKRFKLHGLNYDGLPFEGGFQDYKSRYQWLTSREWTHLLPGFKTKSFFFGPILTDLIIYRKPED